LGDRRIRLTRSTRFIAISLKFHGEGGAKRQIRCGVRGYP
jgi:hypothetical protein